MGYNTTVVVMNDSLDAIAKDPKFGENLARAIMAISRGQPVDVPAYGERSIHVNAATVIETHHSSGNEWVKVGKNTGSVVPFEERLEAEKAIRRLHKRKRASQAG